MTPLRHTLGLFFLGLVLGVGWVMVPLALGSGGSAKPAVEPPAVVYPEATGPPLSVLFLGNSYIHGNAMPSMIAQLARADGQRAFEFVIDAPGAFNLEKHVETRRYQQHFASRRFDFVVLQEQSQRPSYDLEFREVRMNAPMRVLDEAIGYNASRTVLFMTWARRDGHRQSAAGKDSYDRMQKRVAHGYTEIARELGALLAPVGLVWQHVRQVQPQLQLWMPDGSHPTPAGSYLAACVFYNLFYGRAVTGITYEGGIDAEHAKRIQSEVDGLADRFNFRGPEHVWDAGVGPVEVPGIRQMRSEGGCPAGYDPSEGVCYHHLLVQHPGERSALIEGYKNGARPPLMPQ